MLPSKVFVLVEEKEKKSSAGYSELQVLRFRYLYFGFVSLTLINIDRIEHPNETIYFVLQETLALS